MKKTLVIAVVIVILIVGGFFALNTYIYQEKQAENPEDSQNFIEPGISDNEAEAETLSLVGKKWSWVGALYSDGKEVIPSKSDAFGITFNNDGSFSASTDCNNAGGTYKVDENLLSFQDIFSTMMYCEGSQESDFLKLLENTNSFHFTEGGELIFDLMYDSGTVTFK